MQGLRGTWQEMLRCCCGNHLVQSRTERSVWLCPHDQGSDEWHEMRPIKSREPAMKSFKGHGREFDVHFRYTKSPLEEKMAAHSIQYSCLENSMDRETWLAAVHGVAELYTA